MLSANTARLERLYALINEALEPSHLEVLDESHLHAGHAGAETGKGHFAVKISAEAFAGKSLVACHRLVYAAIGDMMEDDVHALRIELITPTK